MKSVPLFLLIALLAGSLYAGGDEFPNLMKFYKSGSIRSDFILVVDRSGSMRKYWDPVKNSLIDFIDALPDGDYISVIGFDSSARQLVIPRKITAESRKSLLSDLSDLKMPDGKYTNLFSSVEYALDEINRPGSSDLNFLVYFTDFVNSPPPDANWNDKYLYELNEKYKNVVEKTGRILKVFAVQLPLSKSAGADIRKFSFVFGDKIDRFIADRRSLADWFERVKEELRGEKLKLAIKQDLKNIFEINDVDASGNDFILSLKNKARMPVKIKKISIDCRDHGLSSEKLNNLQLNPGESRNITIPFNKELSNLGGMIESEYSLHISKVIIESGFNDSTELAKLDIDAAKTVTVDYDSGLIIFRGFPIIYAIVIAAGIILFVSFYPVWKKWLRREWAFNRNKFQVLINFNGLPVRLKKDIFLTNRRVIIANGNLREENDKIIDFNLYITPKVPAIFSDKPERGTYITYECHAPFDAVCIRNGEIVKERLNKGRDIFEKPAEFDKDMKITATFINKYSTDNRLEITIMKLD